MWPGIKDSLSRVLGGLIAFIIFSALGLFLIFRNPNSLWAVASLFFAVRLIDIIITPTYWNRGMRVWFAVSKVGIHGASRHILQTMANPMRNVVLIASGIVVMVAGVLQTRLWLILIGSLIVGMFVWLDVYRTGHRRIQVLELLKARIDSVVSSDIPDEEKIRITKNLTELVGLLKW